jgi:hypothetical protein
MLDSKAMAATLAAAIAVAVLGVGFGLMQPSGGNGGTAGGAAPVQAPEATPGPGVRGLVPGGQPQGGRP